MESAPIERLVEGLKSDRPEEREACYREVIRRYRGLIYAVARRFAADRDTADEVFQEAFLRLFRKVHLLSDPRAFSGFFRRIVVNAAHDVISARQKRAESPLSTELAYSFDSTYLDAFVLVPYLARLPRPQQEIIRLSLFAGLEPAEIAGKLGLSRVSVRVHKFRALKKLKQWLEHDSKQLTMKKIDGRPGV